MATIDSVHGKRVHERQHDEDKDGPLLRKPKSQRKTAKVELVQLLHEDDAKEIGDRKPDGQEHDHQAQVLTPMGVRGAFWGSLVGVV